MSLKALKEDWDSLSKLSSQDLISNKQIDSILSSTYRSFFNRIVYFEIFLLLVYLYFIVLIAFRFSILEILYLEVLGSLALVLLMLLCAIRIMKLLSTYRDRFLNQSHGSALKRFAIQKIRMQRFYLINIVFGFLLTILLLVLVVKIYNEYDLIQSKVFWVTIIPCSLTFIVLINLWKNKYYDSVISDAENLLKEFN